MVVSIDGVPGYRAANICHVQADRGKCRAASRVVRADVNVVGAEDRRYLAVAISHDADCRRCSDPPERIDSVPRERGAVHPLNAFRLLPEPAPPPRCQHDEHRAVTANAPVVSGALRVQNLVAVLPYGFLQPAGCPAAAPLQSWSQSGPFSRSIVNARRWFRYYGIFPALSLPIQRNTNPIRRANTGSVVSGTWPE